MLPWRLRGCVCDRPCRRAEIWRPANGHDPGEIGGRAAATGSGLFRQVRRFSSGVARGARSKLTACRTFRILYAKEKRQKHSTFDCRGLEMAVDSTENARHEMVCNLPGPLSAECNMKFESSFD